MWTINGVNYYDLEEAVEAIKEQLDMEEITRDMLNDCYEPVEILGRQYRLGDILEDIDEDQFQTYVDGEEDNVEERIREDLERMDNGDTENIYGEEVVFTDTDEEEEPLE